MFDNHVHIGHFNEVYYDGLEVVETVMSAGMDGLSFSSTTSCIDNVWYGDVEKEIKAVLDKAAYSSERIIPCFWYIPDYIKQKITAKSAFESIPYKSIKLHPYAHKWDLENNTHLDALYGLFNYAEENDFPFLIHTGHSGIDSADRFELFFRTFCHVRCILAHCRPLDTTLSMLQKYENVFCDTAFVPQKDLARIIAMGLKDKLLFGTDFPITHYFAKKYNRIAQPVSLRRKYTEDISILSILGSKRDKMVPGAKFE